MNMYTADDIKEIWNDKSLSDVEKRLRLAAIVSHCFAERGARCVVVGGFATELYTASNYATADIDIVLPQYHLLREVMAQLGFEKEGRVWGMQDTGFVLDFPDEELDGEWERVSKNETPYGDVLLIGIEDIIIDRIARIQYWGNQENFNENDEFAWQTTDEVVFFLLATYRKIIDWEYLDNRAKLYDLQERLSSFKKMYKKHSGQQRGSGR